ncbi:MAG: ATP-binding protein [Kiritimatiellia bacterium]|jgi:two-component system phosphate regulon sensor histidine kinase PhoR
MKRNLFWALFGPQLVILLACILSLAAFAWHSNRKAVSSESLRVLETQATLASRLVRDGRGGLKTPDELEALCDQIFEETGQRMTVVSPEGRVLADTVAAPGTTLGSHADRPEIVDALSRGTGHSERFSATLRQKMHYVARVVADASGTPLAVVRVAVPREAFDAPLRRSLFFFSLLLVLILGSSVGLSYLFSQRVTRPVRAMLKGLIRMGSGNLGHRLPAPRIPHLAFLTRAINETSERLEQQVRQLANERALREGILGGMREGVLALDHKRRIVLINQAARTLLQLESRPVEGELLDLVVPCVDLLALADSVAANPEPLAAEINFHTPGRKSAQFLAGASRWRSAEGNQDGLLIILNDMTHIRRLEQIRRDFVANVSHELRTPVTSIKGFAETLLDAPPDDEATRRRFMEIILKQTLQIEKILSDMLLLARLEDAGIELAVEPVDVRQLVEHSCELCDSRAAASQVTLRQEIPAGLTVPGHAHLLEQALVNLIDNAIKHGGGGRTVTIRAVSRNQTLRLTVQDQGSGIDSAQAERVFERFYRLDAGRSRDRGGSGLGLAVVKHVVRVHHGAVSFENLKEGGCAFHVDLPLAMPSEASGKNASGSTTGAS